MTQMTRFMFRSALVISGLLLGTPVFAQSTDTGPSATSRPQANSGSPQRQQNQTTNLPPASGQAASDRATKQRTDGEDVTNTRLFPPASK